MVVHNTLQSRYLGRSYYHLEGHLSSKKSLHKCFGDQKTLFYVAKWFAVTNKNGLMTIWHPKVCIIEVSPRRQTSVVFQNISNDPSIRTCGQHNFVLTHKFPARYSNCCETCARRCVEHPAHRVCCIVATTPWACSMCMAEKRCTTAVGRNKFKRWAATPMQSWRWYMCNN